MERSKTLSESWLLCGYRYPILRSLFLTKWEGNYLKLNDQQFVLKLIKCHDLSWY